MADISVHNLVTAGAGLRELQTKLLELSIETGSNGERYLAGSFGAVDCVRYSSNGVQFLENHRQINSIGPEEILLLPTSVSLCGTDLGLIEKAKVGGLPPEAIGKVVGHEAAGFIVGVGSAVQSWKIGQYVCLDSHIACEQVGHDSFDDCVQSGKSCDGIVGGIRGISDKSGEHRHDPPDGYWSRIFTVSQSAIPAEVPLEIAEKLKAPSTLESLGNLYMIQEQLRSIGLVEEAKDTVCIVSGLGATGYPMAAVATQTGFRVFGVNPSEGKQRFAVEQGAVTQAFGSLDACMRVVEKEQYTNLVIVVTADAPQAHEEAISMLSRLSIKEIEDGKGDRAGRKVVVMFGLYADPHQPIKGAPDSHRTVAQREFVFGRQQFQTDDGVEVYGVCGRDLKAWSSVLNDLNPGTNPRADRLIEMLNAAQKQVSGTDPLRAIAELLQQGAGAVDSSLRKDGSLKLVANLLRSEQE